MPAFIVPARNTRHRTACFALYKALLRQAPKIKLPDDLASHPWQVPPIKHHIRKSFRRNLNDTSPRLVTAALRNGYNALSLLTEAIDSSSPAHAEIISFIRSRPLPPATPYIPPPKRFMPEYTPIITLSPESTPANPVYIPTARPLPLDQLSGTRRVPTLVTTALGFPFLRLGKPQSPRLSMQLLHRSRRREGRTHLAQDMQQWDMPMAQDEDRWEGAVQELMGEEGVELDEDEDGGSYERVIKGTLTLVYGVIDDERKEMVARADALLQIMDGEREAADRERRERDLERKRAWEERMRGEGVDVKAGMQKWEKREAEEQERERQMEAWLQNGTPGGSEGQTIGREEHQDRNKERGEKHWDGKAEARRPGNRSQGSAGRGNGKRPKSSFS